MIKGFKLALVAGTLVGSATAYAQPGMTEPISPLDEPASTAPAPTVVVHTPVNDPLATTRRWAGSARLTGLSGIGALPGRNFGGELAGTLRHDEMFVELAMARWKPEKTYMTADGVELGLDTWTVRAGWAGMKTPLRAWVLGEVGELAGMRAMPGVVARMMTGDTPQDRRWKAVGAGFGVAWPMTDTARLFGMVEFAVPVNRSNLMLDQYGTYEPDPLTARSSVGLEIGWR